jgi:hypothetical protein
MKLLPKKKGASADYTEIDGKHQARKSDLGKKEVQQKEDEAERLRIEAGVLSSHITYLRSIQNQTQSLEQSFHAVYNQLQDKKLSLSQEVADLEKMRNSQIKTISSEDERIRTAQFLLKQRHDELYLLGGQMEACRLELETKTQEIKKDQEAQSVSHRKSREEQKKSFAERKNFESYRKLELNRLAKASQKLQTESIELQKQIDLLNHIKTEVVIDKITTLKWRKELAKLEALKRKRATSPFL